MRKALLVIAMVAASFAGGAVVNGPGLAWVRDLLGLDPVKVGPLDPPAPNLAPPVVEVADDPPPTEEPALPQPAPAPSPKPATGEAEAVAVATPTPPEPKPETGPATNSEPEAPRPLDLGNTPPPLAPPASAAKTAATTKPNPKVEPGWGDAPGSAPATAFLPEPRGARPRNDPAVTPASLPKAAPDPAPAPAASESPEAAPPSSEPVKPEPPEPAKPDDPVPDAGWSAIRDRMTALGVSRYWIEGEPAGAVRFRCVVPLAGGGAVAQQFEAEADDIPTAAEAALRRIDLWRATENPPQP